MAADLRLVTQSDIVGARNPHVDKPANPAAHLSKSAVQHKSPVSFVCKCPLLAQSGHSPPNRSRGGTAQEAPTEVGTAF